VKVALVGSPNVGKSVIFNRLTGAYATVSNYPGTTVEVARGYTKLAGKVVEVIDTPGIYSLATITDEERVTLDLLLSGRLDVVVHVVDTRNLQRMLGLTLQLIESGLPVVLDLNIVDEAEKAGLLVDGEALERALGIPVVKTSGALGRGITELRVVIGRAADGAAGRPAIPPLLYEQPIEAALSALEPMLGDGDGVSKRCRGLLVLQEDHAAADSEGAVGEGSARMRDVLRDLSASRTSPSASIARQRQARASELAALCFDDSAGKQPRFREALSRFMIRPATGVPLLLIVLYVGLYLFVGRFGAGFLVDLLEGAVFGRWVNPFITGLVHRLLPWPIAADLFVGDYGIFTLGLRYAVAIILPIVATFFLSFSLLEDSGFLPRLALLVDGLFKRIGLNGRAVIPMVLGFGCDTMATLVARTLETRRERLIATLLLALAIPCSAQLGLILALLSAFPLALAVWALCIAAVFFAVGALSAWLLPGEKPSFFIELPPLRLPRLSNVLAKTTARMRWYLLEIIPVFLVVSVAIWLGKITGIFQMLVSAMGPLMRWIGLPAEASAAFLFGFFRRDYGAAGLFDLARSGLLSPRQLTVAAVTLTLFIPCVAQLAVMVRERGWKPALGIVGFVFPFAFLVGFALNAILAFAGALA
jgi:ferrous iron transport protein B